MITWLIGVLCAVFSGGLVYVYALHCYRTNRHYLLPGFNRNIQSHVNSTGAPVLDNIYENILSTVNAAIIVRAKNGKVIYVNETWRRLSGRTNAEIFSETTPRFSSFTIADGVTPATQEDTPMYQALHGKTVKRRLFYFQRDQSEPEIPVFISGYPLLDDKENQIGAFTVVQDFSNLNEIEVRMERDRVLLETIVKVLPDAFVFRDMSGRAIMMNDAMRNSRTVSNTQRFTDKIVTEDLLDAETGLQIEADETPMHMALAGKTVISKEMIQVRTDQPPKNLLVSSLPVCDKNGRQYGAFAILRDVTELQESSAHRAKIGRTRAVNTLAAGIAHDINNLSAIILGNVQLALRSLEGNKNVRECLKATVDAVQSSAYLTRRLAALGNTLGGDVELIHVKSVISAFMSSTNMVFEGDANISMNDVDERLYVSCDRVQFEAAMLNLLLNAREATATTDGPRVAIDIKLVVADSVESKNAGHSISICVEDNGVGFSDLGHEDAFDPFYTTKDHSEGTGLGLTMVENFAHQLNGQVVIFKTQTGLTRVEMILPCTIGQACSKAFEESDLHVSSGLGETILVVEDRPELLAVICHQLSALNYRHAPAANAEEGLRHIENNPLIELVIADVMLGGGMNGVDMMKAVHQKRPHLATVFISGYVFGDGDIEIPDNQQLLQKPVTLGSLSAAIVSSLEESRAAINGS